jgi:ubiquinone/menaquinone biosynthesis C-methylase UbiE
MDSIEKNKIREFGNPSAYYDNRLYRLFSEKEKDNVFYRMVFYGHKLNVPKEIMLKNNYKRLLKKKIKYQQKRVNRISKFISRYRKPSIWLDLGCGVGQFVEKIAKIEGNFVVGSDTSFASLKKADYLLKEFSSTKIYSLINQDKSEFPFKDNSFDYILSADVLEHVGYKNQIKFFSEIYRILKNNGKAIIHTPNLNRVIVTTLIKKILYIFKGFPPNYITHCFPRDHISLSNATMIKRLSKSVGFKFKIFRSFKENYDQISFLSFIKLDYFLSRSFTVVLSK